MSGRGRTWLRVGAILLASVAMAVLVVLVGLRLGAPGEADPGYLAGAAEVPSTATRWAPLEDEAVRLRPEQLAVPVETVRRPTAHPRTLSMYRGVRAYPGAPPRIAHGLTEEEFRTGTCNACHERGGYVPRFALYAPVTPHPQYGQCLQCHVPDEALVGMPLPDGGLNATCLQCHDPERRTPPRVALDWEAAGWPPLGVRDEPGGPQRVPHDLQLRSNCLACHAGPAAVVEIRTTHPDEPECLECHLPLGAPAPAGPRRQLRTAVGGAR